MVDEYCIAFGLIRGMSIDFAEKILGVIPSERDFFTVSQSTLEGVAGRKHKILSTEYRQSVLDTACREIEHMSRKGVKCMYFREPEFPQRLLDAGDAPILLFGVGDCDLNAGRIISIVGTRRATQYGIGATQRIVSGIAERCGDSVIVSGLAYGIDVVAHQSALNAGLPTVGVLAHGLDTIYPAQHRNIAAQMAKTGGALLSEYTMASTMHRGNFLARNRIVAAIADCTLVVESAEKGGALVTAAIADSYNREVFAVPGKVNDEFSRGCNNLIKRQKAIMITSAQDIFDAMQWQCQCEDSRGRDMSLFPEYTPEEKRVVDYLTQYGTSHVNAISAVLGVKVYELMNTLIDMEFKGYVRAVPGGQYTLS